MLCENLCSLNPNEVHPLDHSMYQKQAAWLFITGKIDTVCCMAPEYEGRGKVLNIIRVSLSEPHINDTACEIYGGGGGGGTSVTQ